MSLRSVPARSKSHLVPASARSQIHKDFRESKENVGCNQPFAIPRKGKSDTLIEEHENSLMDFQLPDPFVDSVSSASLYSGHAEPSFDRQMIAEVESPRDLNGTPAASSSVLPSEFEVIRQHLSSLESRDRSQAANLAELRWEHQEVCKALADRSEKLRTANERVSRVEILEQKLASREAKLAKMNDDFKDFRRRLRGAEYQLSEKDAEINQLRSRIREMEEFSERRRPDSGKYNEHLHAETMQMPHSEESSRKRRCTQSPNTMFGDWQRASGHWNDLQMWTQAPMRTSPEENEHNDMPYNTLSANSRPVASSTSVHPRTRTSDTIMQDTTSVTHSSVVTSNRLVEGSSGLMKAVCRIKDIRKPDFDQSPVPKAVVDKLRSKMEEWDTNPKMEWIHCSRQRNCVTMRLQKRKSVWSDDEHTDVRCESCVKWKHLCVVIGEGGEKLELLPTDQRDGDVGPQHSAYWI